MLKNTVKRILISNSLTTSEEKTVFKTYEKVLQKYFWFGVHTDFEDYDQAGFTNKRSKFIKLLILKIGNFLFALRCLLNILWSTPYVRDLTCDAFHYLGNQVHINIACLGGCLVTDIIVGYTAVYYSLSGQSLRFRFLNDLKNQTIGCKLSFKYKRKLYRRIDLISFFISTLFIPIWFIYSFIFCIPTFIGYFDPGLNFSILGEKSDSK